MSSLAVMKKLVAIGLPSKWLVPVMEAFDDPAAGPTRKRRKRRTKEEMAADAAKTGRKKRKKNASTGGVG